MAHYSMPSLPSMGSDVTALKLVYRITKALIRGAILTAWKTKQ